MNLKIRQHPRDKHGLLERDKVIVQMLSDGYTAQEIADAGSISRRTVEFIIASLFSHFECNNTTHLVAYCLRKKIIK